MKKLLPVLLLMTILLLAGCMNADQTPLVTPTPAASQPPDRTLTPTQPAVPSLPSPVYKNADLVLALNTLPAYGFKIDYPSEWTYKKEHTRSVNAGYNFSSPDEKSYVFIGIANGAGAGGYFYPLLTLTENSLDATSWEYNVIKRMTVSPYCHDGAGNPMECMSNRPASAYYHWRQMNNDTVILPGNVKARRIVFAPDIRDASTHRWYTIYLMHVGPMQGYNFTVPGHFEVARKVPGDTWDYGMGGLAYSIEIVAPTKTDSESPLYDHMIQSFEVTGIY